MKLTRLLRQTEKKNNKLEQLFLLETLLERSDLKIIRCQLKHHRYIYVSPILLLKGINIRKYDV